VPQQRVLPRRELNMERPPPGSLLIKPVSARCNLRCRYCFYRDRPRDPYQSQGSGRIMSDEVLTALVGQFLGMPNAISNFCWQGGEPLLAGHDFFERVFERENALGKGGQRVANAIQTNGTLIDDRFAELFARYRVFIGLSLDGPEKLHDLNRVDAEGRGTHRLVMEAAKLLERHGVEFNILSVVTAVGAGRAAEIYSFLLSQGFHYLQFIPDIERGNAEGGPAPHSVSARAFGAFLCDLFDAWHENGRPRASIRFFDNVMEALQGHPPGACSLQKTCADYVVVEYTGDVYPCDFLVESDWLLGNIMEKPLGEILRAPRWEEFLKIKPNLPRACRRCEYRLLCRGGCPYDRLMAGSLSRPPLLCEGYRMFFDHAAEKLLIIARHFTARRLNTP